MKNHILFQITVMLIGSLLYHDTTKSMSFNEDSQDATRNDTHAFEYFQQRADSEDSESITALGFFYRNGIGTQKDSVMARKYYEIAALKGNTMAMLYLGRMYEDDEPRNYAKAKHWFEKALAYCEPTTKTIAQTALARVENKIQNINFI